MKVIHVTQDEPYGCMIACLAMVLGKSYADVRKDFYTDFSQEGIEMEKAADYLAENGFTVIEKTMTNWMHRDRVKKEMLRPFAPVHIVRFQQYTDAPFGHVVVMTNKGKFLCPQKSEEKVLMKSYAVSCVFGLYK